MQRKMKNCDFSEADIPKTPERKTSRNGSKSVTPRLLSNGRRSRTSSPGSSSVPSVGGRRSINSTPESSSTQRELKKLEDYWTRNNPVTEDSPRLRSNRTPNFNFKECFGESSSVKTLQKDESRPKQLKKADQNSLPESPIPGTITQYKTGTIPCVKFDSRENKTTDDPNEKTDKCSGSPNIFTNLQECFQNQKQSISPTCIPTTRFSQNEPTLDRNRKCNCSEIIANERDAVIQNSNYPNSIPSEATTDFDSSDPDDDDYIPPRKKLRSEVSKDELWDGIPLTITFKRLAPISKASSAKTTSVVSQNKSVITNENKDIPSEKQEILKDTEPIVKLNDFQKTTKRKNSVNSDNDRNCMTKDVQTDRALNNSELKENHQRTKRKRNTRLKEKLTELPTRNGNSNENITSHDSIPVHVKCGSFTVSNGDISQTNRHDEETCSSKLDTTDDKITNDYQGENLLKMTLSQILSVDNKNDINAGISTEKKHGTEEKITYECESRTEDSPSVTISISKTINDIFEEISGPNKLSQNPSNTTDAGVESATEDDSRITRRSRRLSHPSNQNSPRIKTTKDCNEIQAAGSVIDAKSSHVDKSNTATHDIECCTKAIELSSSKHKLFTKNINKCSKTVPPLRIKLKHPANVVLKNKCVPKSKQKSSASSKGKNAKTNKLKNESSIKSPVQKTGVANTGDKEASPADSDVASTSKKKVYTPNSKKKKTARQRKWSPPPSSTIALRLNNERRLSAAGSLLSNAVLNKHACVLWSSENRRHMQLSNPHATLSELDAKLSRKWDNISDKERLKYFQRARDAIKDENRHSNRRTNAINEHDNDMDTVKRYTDDCSVENFQKLSPASQMTEIKKWLNFYNEISTETCSLVITSFKEALAEENRNRVRKEHEQEKAKTKSKSKKNKQKKKEDLVTTIDSNANYRKILFEKIQGQKENVKDILAGKKEKQYRSVLDNYSSMVKRMVCGELVHFAGDVRSDKLTETLYELRALEKDNRLAVTGDVYKDTKYEDILARLGTRDSPDGKTLVCALENTDIDDKELENTCKKIKIFPSLSPNSLANNLPEVWTPKKSDVNLLSPLRIGRSNQTSPVTILTELVAEDLLSNHPQIGFRNAISLLSNKVVPSPTLILPPKGSNRDKSSANKNQNCNIVYTKLQQSRPSVLTTKVNLLN